MGAFFTNIQLKTAGFDSAEITDKVIKYITEFNNNTGFIKVNSEEEADKSIVISISDDSKWLSIYDEEMEDQNSRKLNKLSSGLSKEFKTTALSVLVNDSDSIYIGLNKNGALKDSISNLTKEIDFNKNKPGIWTDILADNFSFEDIITAWQNKNIFVEDFLSKFATFTGLDNSKLLTGYEYLTEDPSYDGIKLNFAQKDKKATPELGLTKFSLLAGMGSVFDVQKGEKQTLGWILTNHGSYSNGLNIIVAGACIEQDLLMPDLVKINYVRPQIGRQNEFSSAFVETVSTTGKRIFYASIEDVFIPKGFKPSYPMTPKAQKKYAKFSYDCALKFDINFTAKKDGDGEFAIFFSPLINPQEGTYYTSIMKGTLEDYLKKNAL